MHPTDKGSICTISLLLQMLIGCGFDPGVDGPPAGNPEGTCPIPSAAMAEDSTHPDRIVGNGTADSCTSDSFLDAVAAGESSHLIVDQIPSPSH